MSDINEQIIKFTGSASMAEGLEVDKDYLISLEGGCYSKEKKSRQDGTYDMHYKVRLMTAEILKENGDSIKMIDKKKWSQKLRFAIEQRGYEYEYVMPRLIANLEQIFEQIYD